MASILFFCLADVLEAYTSRNIDVWAICEGKSLMLAGDGIEELQKSLSMLQKSGSPVSYTLRVYKNVNDPDDITNKTENNGEFRFKLQKDAAVMGGPGVGVYGANPIMDKIQGLVYDRLGKVVDKILSGESEEEKEPTFKQVAIGYLEDPPTMLAIIDKLGALFRPGGAGAAGIPAAIMAGVMAPPAQTAAVMPEYPPGTEQRLAIALNRLEKCDPEILLHLEQLATLAETNPAMYKMALNMLK